MKTALILAGVVFGFFGKTAQEVDLNDLVLLSLSPLDGKAIVRLEPSSGELLLVEVGDTLPRLAIVVRQVLPDRVVFEDAEPNERGERRTIWLFEGANPRDEARIRVFERTPPPEPELEKPKQSRRPKTKQDPNPR